MKSDTSAIQKNKPFSRCLYLALQEDTATKRRMKNGDRVESTIIAPMRMHVFTEKPDTEAMYKDEVRLEEILLEAALAFSNTGAYKPVSYEMPWYEFTENSAVDLNKIGLFRIHAVPELREVRRILSFLNPDAVRLALPDVYFDYFKGFKKSPKFPERDYKNILTWNAFAFTKTVEKERFAHGHQGYKPALPNLSYFSDNELYQTPKKKIIDLWDFGLKDPRLDAVYDVLVQYSDLSYLVVPVPEDKEPWEVFLDILDLFNMKGIELSLPGSFIREEVLESLKNRKISFWAALDDYADAQLRESVEYTITHGLFKRDKAAKTEEDKKYINRLKRLNSYGTIMDFADDEDPDPTPESHTIFLTSSKNPDSLAPICRMSLLAGDYDSAPFGYSANEFYMPDPCFETIVKNFLHGSRCMSAICQTIKPANDYEEIYLKYFYDEPLISLGIIHDHYDASEVRDMASKYLSDPDKLRKRSKTL